jgi:general secretion pathway protein A
MYLEYWGLEKLPFENVPDPRFFYMSKPHEEGLTRLLYAVEMRKGCALLSGEAGCGKTSLSRVFMRKISGERLDVAVISNPCDDPKEFLQDVSYKLQLVNVPNSKVEILRMLNKKLTENMKANKETVLIVDEAQLLTEPTLEEIRLLLNFQLSDRFLITIFLLGQPELINKIKRIKQLEQRIAIRYFLRPFNAEETQIYILFRQKKAGGRKNLFSREAIELVYEYSGGMPRSINNLCDLALLVGFGEKRKMISSETIKDIIDDGEVF